MVWKDAGYTAITICESNAAMHAEPEGIKNADLRNNKSVFTAATRLRSYTLKIVLVKSTANTLKNGLLRRPAQWDE